MQLCIRQPANKMHAFCWNDKAHDIALVKVVACHPSKPLDWDSIATWLNAVFATEEKPVELKGRGCRERLDRLLEKFKAEDTKSLKRYAKV